jgi:hypothetical protein
MRQIFQGKYRSFFLYSGQTWYFTMSPDFVYTLCVSLSIFVPFSETFTRYIGGSWITKCQHISTHFLKYLLGTIS